MTKPILLLMTVVIALLSVWLLPVFIPTVFSWLTPVWQWLLTCLILLSVLLFKAWGHYKSHFNVTQSIEANQDKLVDKQDKQQRKRQLNDDWNQLWKKLHQQHGRNPYMLPWLMLLGTDGSGKSDWLINAGFERISDKASHQDSGIIFWFNEHAVIIELTGHYYNRDKESLAEELWQHLIRLLKRKRPRRPLTGVMAAVSTEQLVLRQPSGLLELARQLRWRLVELNRQFSLQLPAWFLLNQVDSLNGFAEFFRNCNHQQQVTPWGFSLPEAIAAITSNKPFIIVIRNYSLHYSALFSTKKIAMPVRH